MPEMRLRLERRQGRGGLNLKTKPKLFDRLHAAVKATVAGRAKHPYVLAARVGERAPSTVPRFLVGQLDDPPLAAAFAPRRPFRETEEEAPMDARFRPTRGFVALKRPRASGPRLLFTSGAAFRALDPRPRRAVARAAVGTVLLAPSLRRERRDLEGVIAPAANLAPRRSPWVAALARVAQSPRATLVGKAAPAEGA